MKSIVHCETWICQWYSFNGLVFFNGYFCTEWILCSSIKTKYHNEQLENFSIAFFYVQYGYIITVIISLILCGGLD